MKPHSPKNQSQANQTLRRRLPLLRRLRRHQLVPNLVPSGPKRRHQKGPGHLRLQADQRRRRRGRLAHRPQAQRDRGARRGARRQKGRRHAAPERRGFRQDGRGQDQGAEPVHEWETEGQGQCDEGHEDGAHFGQGAGGGQGQVVSELQEWA